MFNIKRKPKNQEPLDENGKCHGEWLRYYDNDRLWYRINYFHDIAHGLCEGYNKDGILMYRGCHDMGRKVRYWYTHKQKYYYLWLI